MKNFNEHTKLELASLTDEQVKDLVIMELARNGIVEMDPPELLEVPEAIKLQPECQLYKIGNIDIAFRSEERAKDFFNLGPVFLSYDWNRGQQYRYIDEKDSYIQLVNIYDKTDIDLLYVSQEEKARKINESMQREYHDNRKRVSEIADTIWSDVVDARQFKQSVDKAIAMYEKYLSIVGGNEKHARELLETAYTDHPDIIEAAAFIKFKSPADTEVAEG